MVKIGEGGQPITKTLQLNPHGGKKNCNFLNKALQNPTELWNLL